MKNFIKINRAFVAKKKVLTFLLALVVGAGTLFAESGTCGKDGDNLTWTLSGGTLTISGTGDMADYSNTNPWYDNRSSIKSVVIEAGVTSIGKYAFYNCENLTSVTIPGSVTSIGNYAFNKCSSLASVTIPEGVISIGPRAFQNCTSLTSIALPEGITSIGIRTFYQCTSLKSVTIPASVANIYDEAFSGCNALTEITCLATTPPTCASNSFYAVTKSIPVYVPNAAAYTANATWSYFMNIREVPVAFGTCGKEGDNLKWTLSKEGVLTISGTGEMAEWYSFGEAPWVDYGSLVKSIVIENGVTSIGGYAFTSCSKMTTLTMGNSVESIGLYAFYECYDLAAIEFPSSVKRIKGSAFAYCESLTSITIHKGIIYIADTAFRGCSGLTSIVVESGNTKFDSRDNCNAIIETETNTVITACQTTTFPSTVTTIGSYAFIGCTKLTSITIPSTITIIEPNPFDDCTGLTSIIVESGNTIFDSRNNCNAIIETATNKLIVGCQTTTIPNTVTVIAKSAFDGCKGLTSVTIPENVTSIEEWAFAMSGLTSITCLATTPPTCGDYCFSSVNKSIPVYVPKGTVEDYKAADEWKDFGDNIQEMKCLLASGTCGKDGDNLTWELDCDGTLTISGTGEMAYWAGFSSLPWSSYYSSIKSVVIEEGVTNIGENAFMNCHGLTKVEISNTVKSIEWCAFADCYALASFTISKSVTNIKGGAFIECIGLTSIIVESGNTTYDSRDNCNAIIETATNTLIQGCKNTIIPYSVTSIGRHAFRNLSSLTSIVIPAGVKNIENMAFSSCGLTSITCEATEPPICGDDCFNAVDKSIPLYVPKGKVADYKAADGWKDFGDNIQEIQSTAIDQISQEPKAKSQKILRDGQLYILYNGQMYNVQGQVVQ